MSGPRRFLVAAPLRAGAVDLVGDEARHARVVLRVGAGDGIEVFDGAGLEASADVVAVERDVVHCRVSGPIREAPAPAVFVELVCALPRAGAADDVVRVATEVGARAIRPLVAERGQWKPEESGEPRRAERFHRAAVAALKQCRLGWLPEFLPPVAVADLRFADGLAIVGSTSERAEPMAGVLARHAPLGRVTVVVGPEGGLTEAEEEALLARGALPVRVGPSVLRVETAVVALVSHVIAAA